MESELPFARVARLAEAADNVAIATRRLDAGARVTLPSGVCPISATVLEGHRFAVRPIRAGEPLLSWGLPFGLALRDIAPGDCVCNEKVLAELRRRSLDFTPPDRPNFRDHRIAFALDESGFHSAEQVPLAAHPRTFDGFAREGGRGAGTRNFIVVMGTTSRTASYARLLARRFANVRMQFPNLDGVVAVAHTEGGGPATPHNLDFTLRTLAGFLVHPNVAAVLAVDLGTEPVTNARLREFMEKGRYPLRAVLHRFLTVKGGLEAALREGEAIVRGWLEPANSFTRSPQPLAHLRLALQCGGSDAFSGVSGNPLAGWVAKEIIRHGGSANLAETSELIGAEPYMLAKVRDLGTARKFLRTLDRFQEWAGWHGHSAEGNPSGGNLYRGLHNIVIKSIGAARKKDPETRLDYCIDYSEPMTAPGFYFMDSPGNDLESIAGQVASGCNVIHFITGNGSITNFPFVPTVKIVTTTGRYDLLRNEMDVNAGRFLDGVPMDELGRETFEQTLRVASGERSAGEKAGHSQVQLWRDWAQTDASRLSEISRAPKPAGEPLAPPRPRAVSPIRPFTLQRGTVGLILPTSLCSGQIAQMIAARLNADLKAAGKGDGHFDSVSEAARRFPSPALRAPSPPPGRRDAAITRYVALPHTEGCGNSRGESETLYLRTLTSHLRHPLVRRALLLEHGCEKTHNDELRAFLADHGLDSSRFGFASIQLDGGIEAVTKKVVNWFLSDTPESAPCPRVETGPGSLRLGLIWDGAPPANVAEAFALLTAAIAESGGTVVLPVNPLTSCGSRRREAHPFKTANDQRLLTPAATGKVICERLELPTDTRPTLAYGQFADKPGLHLMETPTEHLVETLTGLAATGVEVILAHVSEALAQGHPLVPVLQVTTAPLPDADIRLDPGAPAQSLADALVELVVRAASGEHTPRAWQLGNTDFQITRGLVGVSL